MEASREILERARKGDNDARDVLLQAHYPALRSFVRRRLGRSIRARESSVDLAQSICREALEDLDRFEVRASGSFRGWLLTRAENKIRDRARFWSRDRRASKREVELPDDAAIDRRAPLEDGLRSFLTPSREASAREELERVEHAFLALPRAQREVILLARITGLPHEDVARAMGRSTSATRSLLSRALARLALLLEQSGGSEPQGPNVTM